MPQPDTSKTPWSIHILGKEQKLEGFWEPFIFRQGRIHTFFMLVKDGRESAELHFTAKKRTGKTGDAVNKLNVIQSLADLAGIGSLMSKLVNRLHLNPYFLLLKGIETRPRQSLQDRNLAHYAVIEGDARHIFSLWNKTCTMALEINNAEIPFTHNVNWGFGRKPANCQSASKTILAKLGPEFNTAAAAIAHKYGRSLDREISLLAADLTDEDEMASLEDLENTHKELAARLYKTSGYRNERVP